MIFFDRLTNLESDLTYSQRLGLLAKWLRDERKERNMNEQDGDDLCRGIESALGDENLCKAGFKNKIEDALDYCEYYGIGFTLPVL
jgi:hypothetical protein